MCQIVDDDDSNNEDDDDDMYNGAKQSNWNGKNC